MILPTKYLPVHRSALGIGSAALSLMDGPVTVSELWDRYRASQPETVVKATSYDAFILGLDFLCMLGAIQLEGRMVSKAAAS